MCAFVRLEDHLSLMPQPLPFTQYCALIYGRSEPSSLATNSCPPAGP